MQQLFAAEMLSVEAPWLRQTTRYSPKDTVAICSPSFRNNFNPCCISPIGPKHHSIKHKRHREGTNYCPYNLQNYNVFFRYTRSIKTVNCSGPAVSSQQKSFLNRKSLFSAGHAFRLMQEVPISQPHSSFKGFKKPTVWRNESICPSNHMELQCWLHMGRASGSHKSPQEAAISVCFINPTKQFNSFVQGSSTSLINKSGDIIFQPLLKSLKCQAF